MSTGQYPIELKQRLHALFEEKGSMLEAVVEIGKEFPKYKRRLTVRRAYQVDHWFRNHQPEPPPQERAKEQMPWALVSDEQREKILGAAKKLRGDHVRWKVIVDRLQEKHPELCIPDAINLARIAGAGGSNKSTTQNQKPSLAKHLVLQISNAGSLDFKAEINLDIARRVIQECLS